FVQNGALVCCRYAADLRCNRDVELARCRCNARIGKDVLRRDRLCGRGEARRQLVPVGDLQELPTLDGIGDGPKGGWVDLGRVQEDTGRRRVGVLDRRLRLRKGRFAGRVGAVGEDDDVVVAVHLATLQLVGTKCDGVVERGVASDWQTVDSVVEDRAVDGEGLIHRGFVAERDQ